MTDLRSLWNYGTLPTALVRYLAVVSIAGPMLAFAFLATGSGALIGAQVEAAIVLIGLAAIAEHFPVHLTHKTNANLATAVYLAMVMVLPLASCPLAALIGVTLGQAWRLTRSQSGGIAEPVFNIGQTAIYVSAAAFILGAAGMEQSALHSNSPAMVICAMVALLVMHATNTALVAGAASRQLNSPMLRVWLTNLRVDLVPVAAMGLVGICAAVLAVQNPFLVPALAIPAWLIHRAISENVLLHERIHASLEALVEIVELRDPYTAGHSRRVAVSAGLIARELGLTAEEQDEIVSAGRVHDVGKIGISAETLSKPGKLTDVQWNEMQQHPVMGAEVLAQFGAWPSGIRLVRGHHESWNGAGYPDRLAGTQIPFGARILAVADTFDALTSDRPYRFGKSGEDALTILAAGSGTQWDPRVVTAMTAILERDPALIPRGHMVPSADEGEEVRQAG